MANDEPPKQTPDPPAKTAAPSIEVVRLGYIAVGVFAVIGVFFTLNDHIFVISEKIHTDDFQWFALLYVAAQAIERLLEPFMGMVKGEEVTAAKTAIAKATGADGKAEKQTALSQIQADRGVIAWAIASSIALVVCGIMHLGIIGSLADVTTAPGFSTDVFDALNIVITGLVIGAGTKPLHDLISRIEKAKNNADPETGS